MATGSKKKFYSTNDVRMDNIKVKGYMKKVIFLSTKFALGWFAKERAFIQFQKKDLKFLARTNNNDEEDNVDESNEKHCFVQYFDVLPKKDFFLYRMERALIVSLCDEIKIKKLQVGFMGKNR